MDLALMFVNLHTGVYDCMELYEDKMYSRTGRTLITYLQYCIYKDLYMDGLLSSKKL